MPYFIQGNAKDIFTAFGREAFVAKADTTPERARDLIMLDIPRSPVFGTSADLQLFSDTWQDSERSDHISYTQGNMFAGSLYVLFGIDHFRKEAEDDVNYFNFISNLSFGFVDENRILSGLYLIYRKDDPYKWMIGLTKNANKSPEDCEVFLLSSASFSSCDNNKTALPHEEVASLMESPLVNHINFQPLLYFVKKMIIDGKVNPYCERIKFLNLNTITAEAMEGEYDGFFDPAQLKQVIFAINPVLEGLLEKKVRLRLSAASLKACVDKKSSLYQNLLVGIHQELCANHLESIILLHENIEKKMAFVKFLINNPDYKGLLELWEKRYFQLTEPLYFLYQLKNDPSAEQQKKLPLLFRLYFENPELTAEKLNLLNSNAAMNLLLPILIDMELKEKVIITEHLISYLENPDKTVKLTNKINNISDQTLKQNSLFFVQVMDQIRILQDLNCSDAVLALVADTSEKGARFRRIISKVQQECIPIPEYLKQASKGEEKWQAYQAVEGAYRKDLYLAAYGALVDGDSSEQFQAHLESAQKKVEAAVHIDRHPQLRKAMMVLTNFITLVCTLSVANHINKYKTGHFFFYTQPKSADTVERLGRDIEAMVAPSA